ncbi:hypothetical protein NFI96_014171, partial [Prochilodus magdalenae]
MSKSRSMGVSKQLSNDLKTKIVHRHGLGEGYRKLSEISAFSFQSPLTGTGNLVKIEGRMDSNQYQQILETNVQESVTKLKLRRGWIFQQDNDPKHCSKSTNAFMQ